MHVKALGTIKHIQTTIESQSDSAFVKFQNELQKLSDEELGKYATEVRMTGCLLFDCILGNMLRRKEQYSLS